MNHVYEGILSSGGLSIAEMEGDNCGLTAMDDIADKCSQGCYCYWVRTVGSFICDVVKVRFNQGWLAPH